MSHPAAVRSHSTGTQPPYRHDAYVSTQKRSPSQPLIAIPRTLSERSGPSFDRSLVGDAHIDLTRFDGGIANGERIVLSGRVSDEDGRPVSNTLIELWQANAAGRYLHERDTHDAPLDPHFKGESRVLTDDDGRYRFLTIRPGAYPWGNHRNAWRPAHVHFSLFGNAYTQRLVTQMYFPGDPLLAFDPIFCAVPEGEARTGLIARFDWETTEPDYALGFRFDIVLAGRGATFFET